MNKNIGDMSESELKDFIIELQEEIIRYERVINKLKNAIVECWYMDSKNVGEQVFLKKCELNDILKEIE